VQGLFTGKPEKLKYSSQEISADFPYLTDEDILACLKYAAERESYTLANAA
jgi:uncharacterized protein (DUF433 family)